MLVTVRRWLGIPYAEQPERWEPPGAVIPFDPSGDWSSFGPSAVQPTGGMLDALVPGMAVSDVSETGCLTLNVWAPENAETLPVLFWIHGGAYQIGGSSLETYDGTRLAERGAVVVSCNYRLGALGFAVLPGHTANVALLDQLAALRWVQENVASFGGDASRVCVFGESAGAGCIRHLLGTAARKGLFRRAILQSPGAETVPRSQAEELAARFVEHLGGVAPEDAPVDLILIAQEKAAADMMATMGFMPWSPVVDGDVLPAAPPGDCSDVDIIVGTTSEELRLFGGTPEQTEEMMRIPARRMADDLVARNPRTYTYSFEWSAPNIGAAHAVDLPFTFDTFDKCGWGAFVGVNDEARRLAAEIGEAWVSFAATGDPGWPAHPETKVLK